jgi:hypothetical protein
MLDSYIWKQTASVSGGVKKTGLPKNDSP